MTWGHLATCSLYAGSLFLNNALVQLLATTLALPSCQDMLVQSLQLRTASLRRLNVSLRSSARPGSSRSCGSLDLEWPESGALPTRAATAAAAASSTKQLQEDGEGDAGCGGLEHGEASQAQLGLLDSGSPGPLVVL